MLRSLPASFLVLGMSLSHLAAAAPADALIQCTYKAEEAKALCMDDFRGNYVPCRMHTLRIEHRKDGSVLAALGDDKPATARLKGKDAENFTYTWKNIWTNEFSVDLDSSATAWDEFTIPTQNCNTRRTTVSLNLKNPAQSSVSFDETQRECGGMSFLTHEETDVTHTKRDASCTVVSPITPWAPVAKVPPVRKPVPQSMTTQVGAVFTNVSAQYPQFSEAWRAPNGIIWSGAVQKGPYHNEDPKVLPYCNNKESYATDCWTSQPKAARYCESIGARLPTVDEIKQMMIYMGEGSDPTNKSSGGYYPQVLLNMADVFPISTADPAVKFAESIGQFDSQKPESVDRESDAIRCVLSPAAR